MPSAKILAEQFYFQAQKSIPEYETTYPGRNFLPG
jgi:hypothetical protein